MKRAPRSTGVPRQARRPLFIASVRSACAIAAPSGPPQLLLNLPLFFSRRQVGSLYAHFCPCNLKEPVMNFTKTIIAAAVVCASGAALAQPKELNVICSVQAPWCNLIQTTLSKS